MSSFSTRQRQQDEAVDAIRKFLTHEGDAVTALRLIEEWEENESTGSAFYAQRFCEASGLDPDAIVDHDGDLEPDIDALMDLVADMEEHQTEMRDPFDTWEEARGER